VEESIWKGGIGKDTYQKNMELCNRVEERLFTKERESILIVKAKKKEGTSIHGGPAKKRLY